MNKYKIMSLVAIALTVSAIVFYACEKENNVTPSQKHVFTQKSGDGFEGMYMVIDEGLGIYLRLQDSTYVTLPHVERDTASGTGTVNTVKDKNGFNIGIRWSCSGTGDNCGVAREVNETGQTIRTGKWVEVNGGMLIVFEK
jgi:hypothetical protein